MRSHGVPNFPDPNSSGQISYSASSGINTNSSAYQTASTDCKSLNPAGTAGSSPSSSAMAIALKTAICMRKNGVPNYPDPKVGAGGSIQTLLPLDIDVNSPTFQRAQQKCGTGVSVNGKPVPPPPGA